MFFEVLVFAWILIKFGQNPVNHVKKLLVQSQLKIFKTVLASFINPQHELCLLAKEIDWNCLEKEFAPLYGELGSPSIPIRIIVSLLLLKQVYDLAEEAVMYKYNDSPYSQLFWGEIFFLYE
jgi:transposase, IS5 family